MRAFVYSSYHVYCNKMRANALYEIQLSFIVVILHYRLYWSFIVPSSVPHGEIACNYFMYDSFFRRYIDTHHYFTHTYTLTYARIHTHTRARAHAHTHTHTLLFVHY